MPNASIGSQTVNSNSRRIVGKVGYSLRRGLGRTACPDCGRIPSSVLVYRWGGTAYNFAATCGSARQIRAGRHRQEPRVPSDDGHGAGAVLAKTTERKQGDSMATPDVYTARKELFDCLDRRIDKVWPCIESERRDWANEAAACAARFVAALHEAIDKGGGSKELDRRFTMLANITGLGSPYQFSRDAAFRRLESLKEASSDDKVERVLISNLVTPILPEYAPKDFLVWEDVDRLVGGVESILWWPDELSSWRGRLAEFAKYPELPDFSRELGRVLSQMEADHLWGSFLLAASSRVHRAAQPDWYGLLEHTLLRLRDVVQVIKDAADDLFVEFHVDPERFEDDERQLGILVAMLKMKTFSITTRRKSDDICKEAFGSSGDRNAFSLLHDKGLIKSKGGSGGGCWLTPVGCSIAKNLREQGVRTAGDATAPANPAAGNQARTESSTSVTATRQGASSPVTKEEHRQIGSRVVASKSTKEEVDRRLWDARMWVQEYLQEKPWGDQKRNPCTCRAQGSPYIASDN